MPNTKVVIHEYSSKTKSFIIKKGVPVTDSVWNDCVDAIQCTPYKSSQQKHAIAKPGAWSDPGNNLGARAVTTRWRDNYKQQPHVHAGSDVRAVIGCRLWTHDNPDQNFYKFMKIYIGEFG